MQTDYAGNLSFFLLEQTGSIFGTWSGKMSAAEQRKLCGRHLGKGTIIIDGASEMICNRVKVCFGLDYDDRNLLKWKDLQYPSLN
jgi:hypothetical protein